MRTARLPCGENNIRFEADLLGLEIGWPAWSLTTRHKLGAVPAGKLPTCRLRCRIVVFRSQRVSPPWSRPGRAHVEPLS